MIRYYCTCETYNDTTDMLTFIKHDESIERFCTCHEYELRTGYKPITRNEVKRIISQRVVYGIRGYVFEELQNKGITVVFVRK